MDSQNSALVEDKAFVTDKTLSDQIETLQPDNAHEKIQDWLISYLAELLDLEHDEIDIKRTFEHYGLDSAAAAGLIGDMETWLGKKLAPTLLYNYPNIKTLTEFLAGTIR